MCGLEFDTNYKHSKCCSKKCSKINRKKRKIIYMQKYSKLNKSKIKNKAKIYYQKNQDHIRNSIQQYRKSNKESVKIQNFKYRQKVKNNPKLLSKQTERIKRYNQKNRAKIRSVKRKYEQRLDRKKIHLKYQKKRRKNNPPVRLNGNLSSGIRNSLKSGKSGITWSKLVDFTLGELILHLEKQFTKNMNWENYGTYWHLDHRIPKSWFKFTKSTDQSFKDCWALDNLQPKKAIDNNTKSNKFAEPSIMQFGELK